MRRRHDSDVEKLRSRWLRIGRVTFQAIVEGLGGNTQYVGRASFVASGELEGPRNQFSFNIIQGRAEANLKKARRLLPIGFEFRGQIADAD